MKISQFQIVIFAVFIIYPFAALPLIFVEIYNKKYYALNYLAIFMGLLAYLWIPSGDVSRMQSDFEIIKHLNFADFLSIKSFDFLYMFIMYFFAKLSINFEYIRFVLCTISYLFYFKIYLDIIKVNKDIGESKRFSFLAFLMFFFFIRFSGFLTGVRFTVAMSLCFYGVYLVVYKNKNKGWLLLLLSAFTHFSMWLILLITLIVKKINLKFNKYVFVIVVFIGLLMSTTLIELVIDVLPIDDVFKSYLKVYTSGHYATEEFLNQTLLFRISRLASYIAIYPAIIYVLNKKVDISFYSVFLCIVVFLSFCMNMDTTFGRYAFLGVIFFIIPFLLKYQTSSKNHFFYFLFFLSLVTYTASIYTVKRELQWGKQYKILYTPLPLIFMSTYDAKWVEANILDNGGMKNAPE
jgi:hypothetical protein